MKFYAHTHPNDPDGSLGRWQLLPCHLLAVARLARDAALAARPDDADFADAANLAGLLHDLGKYRPEFQAMLRRLRPRGEQTRHKHVGAAYAIKLKRSDIAFAIAGHHGGMPDRAELREDAGKPEIRELTTKLTASPQVRADLGDLPGGVQPPRLGNTSSFDIHTRLLFSCLVDADWRDTADHQRQASGLPQEPPPPALNAAARLDATLGYIAERSQRCRDETLRRSRDAVLKAALDAAESPPGLFTLTVPTGGGKTLASLAFALSHAEIHGLRRVIYVAPYLSIIEQNAREIRRALGETDESAFVLEHHSLAEPMGGSEDEPRDERSRLAENWDAPVVITTSVQFFESLFSNQPGACRKLHNIARSVVILDECQTVPPGLIAPTCAMLESFSKLVGCSVVLSTATQPAWSKSERMREGLTGVREIVPADVGLFERLRRVRVHWPARDARKLTWEEVADELAQQPRGLCVVNTKSAAIEVFRAVRRSRADALHLSTNMCPAHRLAVIDTVRTRLERGEPCLLVSTQLIEAGVDLDFPLVLREMAPLDSIIQAAGRCNREGLLNGSDGEPGGKVVVFRNASGKRLPDHWHTAGTAVLEQNFLAAGHEPDIGNPEDIRTYFERMYCAGSLDERGIEDARRNQNFAEVRDKYKLIDDATTPVLVETWSRAQETVKELLEQALQHGGRRELRRLAPYQVNLRTWELAGLEGNIVTVTSTLRRWTGHYDDDLGITTATDVSLQPV